MSLTKYPFALDIQPLGKGRLNFYAPNQWTREYETDAAGEAVADMVSATFFL